MDLAPPESISTHSSIDASGLWILPTTISEVTMAPSHSGAGALGIGTLHRQEARNFRTLCLPYTLWSQRQQ